MELTQTSLRLVLVVHLRRRPEAMRLLMLIFAVLVILTLAHLIAGRTIQIEIGTGGLFLIIAGIFGGIIWFASRK